MSAENNDISEEEFAQYDRQIRLWGLEAQKRLRQATVLVAGLGGLGAEVVKNIVLAGIKAITLLDIKDVSEIDMHNQLLITPEHKGKNRAEASKVATTELNPNVVVTVDTEPIETKNDEFFKTFDIVCLTEVPLDLRIRINEVCRMEGIKFFCGDVYGYYGYCFADLGMHQFAKEEVKKVQVEIDAAAGEPAPKKLRSDNSKVEESTVVKVTDEFCSLEESFTEDWSKRTRRALKNSSPVFFIMQIIDKFEKIMNRRPTRSEEDHDLLQKLRADVIESAKVPESFIPVEFSRFCISQLNPICAVTGGVLGQEILKTASKRDPPHNNYFFFDGRTCSGIVDQICPPYE